MKPSEIQDRLMKGNCSPAELGEMVTVLAGYYSYKAGQLEDILVGKASTWIEIRATQKSDKATDRQWDATTDGQEEIRLRFELKRIEQMRSAVKAQLRIKEGEANNIF